MTKTMDLPTADELLEVFELVLSGFANLPLQAAEGGADGLQLRRAVLLRGPAVLYVLAATTPRMGLLLAEAASGEAPNPDSADDAFTELVNLWVGHLCTQSLAPRGLRFIGHLPKDPAAEGLPPREPDQEIHAEVEGEPLHLALWAMDRGAEAAQ